MNESLSEKKKSLGNGRRKLGLYVHDMLTSSDPSEPREELSLVREHLFAARTVLIFGEITTKRAAAVVEQLLALAEQGDTLIRVILHSEGGHVEAADTIYDVIRFVRPQVKILGTGWVASAGALIFASAKRENRFALPNTRFMIHQPLGGVQGQASDVEIEARQVLTMRRRLNETFARATGNSLERIACDTERNYWMKAEEAVSYGLVGTVVATAEEFRQGGLSAPGEPTP